jgi:putative hydrolase of the HAD superfamily
MNYQHIFFDLDLTLWDFEKNSTEALTELFDELEISSKYSVDFQAFVEVYLKFNETMWDQYRNNQITKEELRVQRFHQSLLYFGINDKKLSENLGDGYIAKGPLKTNLFPFAVEVLDYLASKYKLHIITNGFAEVQEVKLVNSGIRQYFQNVVTSESAGYKKPDPRIFHYSLYRAKAKSKKSIMIGDHLEIDCVGARNAGLDQVYFNPKKASHREMVTYEIDCLSRLKDIF